MGKLTQYPKNVLASNASTKSLSRRGIIRTYRVDLSLSRECSPKQWKKVVIVAILKKKATVLSLVITDRSSF
jgi:hypothetical protein